MIYLDNAATTFPKPDCVIRQMAQAQRFYGANPGRGGHSLSMKAGEKVFETREALADFFSVEAQRVIFTENCTSALNTAIKGSVKKGDHIIISSLEHNSVLRPVHKLFEKGEITYDVAMIDPKDDENTMRNFSSLIRKNTSLIVCTYVSNVFGTVLPVKKIGELAKKKGIRFIVDGAQAAGAFEINLNEMNIDILCLPCHKGLLGPLGLGAIVLQRDLEMDTLTEGGTGSFSMNKNQPDFLPDKFESGTLNLPAIVGTKAGIDFIKNFGGVRAVHEKEMNLCKRLISDIGNIKNVNLYDFQGSIKAPVVAFNVKGKSSEETAEYLNKRNIAVRAGYHCSYLAHTNYGTKNQGIVRVSPGIFNRKEDILFLINSIKRFATADKIC